MAVMTGEGLRRRITVSFRWGAYQLRSSAEQVAANIRNILGEGVDVRVSSVQHEAGTIFRVRVGPVDSSEKLSEFQELLVKNGLSKGQPLP